MKKILIAGGSHSDIPMIKAAKAAGFHTITSGNRSDDRGHQFSDEVHLEDFSNKEAVLALAKRLEIDAICSSSNDFSLISSAYVAEQLGLPGFDSYETTLTLHHKDRFRQLASQIGLPCPKARSFTAEAPFTPADIDGLSFPLIVKPIDLTGGKGVSQVGKMEDLAVAVKKAFDISRAKRIVIEEFFSGTLHSYSTLIKNQKVVFEYADNEFSFLNPYLVSTSTSPARIEKSILPELRASTEKVARHLKLADGILHAQFLANGRDFIIIEYTRRCPGDFYAIPVQQSTGIDYTQLMLHPCLGVELMPPADFAQKGFYSRHCIMAESAGEIVDIRISDDIKPNIIDSFSLRKPGDHILNHLVDKAGILFLRYSSEEEMVEKNRNINTLVQLVTRPIKAVAV